MRKIGVLSALGTLTAAGADVRVAYALLKVEALARDQHS